MEKFKKEIEDLEKKIKTTLDTATANDNLEQLKFKLELARADFNNYSPSQEKATQKEVFIKYTEFLTTYEYLKNKLESKIFEIVEQKAKKALEELTTADFELNSLLNNDFYYCNTIKQKTTQSKSNTIWHIINQLKRFLQVEGNE